MAAASDKTKPFFPRAAGLVKDGYSNETEATATCFCGDVQLAFPVEGEGFAGSFVCNCADCRKITASMFASNFCILNTHLKHLRGQEKLKTFTLKESVLRGNEMTNYFCSNCGTLLYRIGDGFPGQAILRLGTVDDLNLVDTKLRPQVEIFTKDRVSWFTGVEGVPKVDAME